MRDIGILDWMFPKKKEEPQPVGVGYKMITDMGEGFYAWDGKIFKSDIVRSCIRPKARAIGKMMAKHILDTEEFKMFPSEDIKFLLEEPNPLMSGQVMQEKVAIQLELNNNAFILIKRDKNYRPYELYPIPALTVDMLEGNDGDLYLKFWFKDGKYMISPYSDVIHLRQDFNSHNLFGDSPQESLAELMENITTIDQGMRKAIKNSAIIKWIMKFASVMKPEDVKMQVEEFTKRYLSIENEGGAAASDPRYDLEQVKHDNYLPDDKQMQKTIDRIYRFFNTNEKIVQSNYDEDEWNAYYESVLQPVALQLSNEFTRKLFTKNERIKGNKIVFESTSLMYASLKTRLELVSLVDRGALVPNDWNKLLGLPPVEGGDKPIRRLDTAVIDDGAVIKGGESDDDKDGKTGTDDTTDGDS